MTASILHRILGRAEEALLARTLIGRHLERDVRRHGDVAFERGAEIDKRLLDQARELDLLEEVAAAAESGTSDRDLEELFRWLASRRHERHGV